MASPVVWFEVLGQNAEKLREFYSDLFDWKFQVQESMNYGMMNPAEGEKGIGGGVGAGMGGMN
jgi:uncharacterized protein